jgi:hypothetical protein
MSIGTQYIGNGHIDSFEDLRSPRARKILRNHNLGIQSLRNYFEFMRELKIRLNQNLPSSYLEKKPARYIKKHYTDTPDYHEIMTTTYKRPEYATAMTALGKSLNETYTKFYSEGRDDIILSSIAALYECSKHRNCNLRVRIEGEKNIYQDISPTSNSGLPAYLSNVGPKEVRVFARLLEKLYSENSKFEIIVPTK